MDKSFCYFALAFVIGFLIDLLLGYIADKKIKQYSDFVIIPPPKGIGSKAWRKLIPHDKDDGGDGAKFIGLLERTLFYAALVFSKPEFIIGWFAFKLASKWETWTNVIKPPQKLRGVSEFDLLVSRKRWGTQIYQRFLIGTLLNVLAGAVSYAVFYLVSESLRR